MNWHLPDARLSARADQIFDTIVSTGSLVLRRIGVDRAGEIAAHRFLGNERVPYEAIVETLSQRTLEASKRRCIVAIQDTTEINFAGRDASRTGLGMAGADHSVGFFVHPVISVDRETGAVLGLVDAELWTRAPGPTPNRNRLAFADKESARWLRGVEAAQERLREASGVVVVGDRESDIYSLFVRLPKGAEVVVRASHNRKLKGQKRLFEMSGTLQDFGNVSVEVSARPGQKARTARVVLRAGAVTLPRPADSVERGEPGAVTLNFVEAIEEDAPKGCKAVCWRLLTTLPVSSKTEAQEILDIYAMRWRIEEVFRVLKTDGLDLEATQVEAADRLFKLAALGIAAATRIVQLVDARDESSRPADDVVDPDLIDPIDLIGKTLEGKTERQKNPHPKGSLSWLSWIVARLGGWNCYYKPPGPKTMAIGWRQLASMIGGFMIAGGTADV